MMKRQRRSFLGGIRHRPPRPKRRFLLPHELSKPTCVPVQSNPGRTALILRPLLAPQHMLTSDVATVQPFFSSCLPAVLTPMSFLP
ncbi:LR8 protein, isoform CRA_c [Rattus norvegicus]|uniref:LR8 protein, isoform CRA_c n=1 Tax=Rattus norvegicus TaxID=10116 RepID=A6K0I3_RAT|nr:LR8 protein, isoform CRA_c [Rattus norvegicus]